VAWLSVQPAVAEMIEMAEWAEDTGWDSVWVGKSIFAKPLYALVLLDTLASRTRVILLGPRSTNRSVSWIATIGDNCVRGSALLPIRPISLNLASGGGRGVCQCV